MDHICTKNLLMKEDADWKEVNMLANNSEQTGDVLGISQICTKIKGHIKKPKLDDI